MQHDDTPQPLYRQRWFLALAALVLLVRVAFWLLTDHILDSEENFRLVFATQPDPWRLTMVGPIHLLLLKFLTMLFARPFIVGPLLSFVCGYASFWLGTALAWRIYGNAKAAAATAIFLGFAWPLIQYSRLTKVEPIFTLALFACLWFLTAKPRRLLHLVAAGVALTLATGLRYEAWALVPVLTLSVWWRLGGRFRWREAIAFGLAAGLFPAFWLLFNAIVAGDPMESFHYIADSTFAWRIDEWTAAFLPAITVSLLLAIVLGTAVATPSWPAVVGHFLFVAVMIPVIRFGLPSSDMKYMIAPLTLWTLPAGAGVAWLLQRSKWVAPLVALLLLGFFIETSVGFRGAVRESQLPPNTDAWVAKLKQEVPARSRFGVLPSAELYRAYFQLRLGHDYKFVESTLAPEGTLGLYLGLERPGDPGCPPGTTPLRLDPWFLCK